MPTIKRISLVEVKREVDYEITDNQLETYLGLEPGQAREDFLLSIADEEDVVDITLDENDVEYVLPMMWAASVEDAFVVDGPTVHFRPNTEVDLFLFRGVRTENAEIVAADWRKAVEVLYEHLATTSVGNDTPEKSGITQLLKDDLAGSDDEPIPYTTTMHWRTTGKPLTPEQMVAFERDQQHFDQLGVLAKAMEGMSSHERKTFYVQLHALRFGYDREEESLQEFALAMEGMTPPSRARFKDQLNRLHFGHDVDEA